MRGKFVAAFALGSYLVLAAAGSTPMPVSAATHLKLQCEVRDLAPGAHVWVEVRPEYHQAAMAQGGQDSGLLQEARGESVWQFDVPASGQAGPLSHDFAFPVDLDRKSTDPIGSIRLKTRFKIDHPAGQDRVGYGEVYEMILAMPVPPGTAPLSRCLRLREVGDKMIAETAADCLDASFGKNHIHLRPPNR